MSIGNSIRTFIKELADEFRRGDLLDEKHISSGSMLREWGLRGEWPDWNADLQFKLKRAEKELAGIHGLREQREALTQTLPRFVKRQAA